MNDHTLNNSLIEFDSNLSLGNTLPLLQYNRLIFDN